jgi:hypothetical protein
MHGLTCIFWVNLTPFSLQARQATRAEQAQTALAREADKSQAAFDIAHQQREARLKEVELHLDVGRQLRNALGQIMHEATMLVMEFNAEEDAASAMQRLGEKIVATIPSFQTPESVQARKRGENHSVRGDVCLSEMPNTWPEIHAFFGYVAPGRTAVSRKLIPTVLEQRFLADPASALGRRYRQIVSEMLLPVLQELSVSRLARAATHALPWAMARLPVTGPLTCTCATNQPTGTDYEVWWPARTAV